jgi:hypothetical protein
VEPAVAQHRRGGGRAVPVPLDDVVAADDDLADLAGGQVVAVVADDLHLHAGDRRADRARLVPAPEMVGRGDRRGLAEPVALDHLAAERRLEPAHHLRRHRRPARDADAQRGEVVGVPGRMAEQGGVHRRHALQHGHAVALHDLQRLAGVEALQQRQAAAGADCGVERAGLAERVEQRQGAEGDVVLDHRVQAPDRVGVPDEVGVGQLGTLGRAGGSRGIEDHRGVGRVALAQLPLGSHATKKPLELAGVTNRQSVPAPQAPASTTSASACHANSSLAPESLR